MENKVDNLSLKVFRKLLETATRKELIEYFDKFISQNEKEKRNNLKRMIYAEMKRCKNIGNESKSREYYCIYMNYKNNKLTYDQAMEKYMNI